MNKFNPGIETKNSGSIIRSSSKALTVTSKNFEELRNQITEVYNKRVALLNKLKSAKRKLFFLSLIHYLSYLFVVGFFYKNIAEKRKEQQAKVGEIDEQLSDNFIKLEFADKSQLEKSWLNCIDAFEELMESEKIWDITYTEGVDKVKARTIAETATKRTLIKRKEGEIEFVKSDLTPLFLPNANGPDLFFFPTFLVLFKDNQKFGIFDLKEIKTTLRLFGYIEEGKVPNDTEVIDHTWKKSNKDGSRDKRFKDNYQIPIVKYGEMLFETESGLEESFFFSNFDAFTNFAKKYEYHVSLLAKTNLTEPKEAQEKEQPTPNHSSSTTDKEAIRKLMKISCFGLGAEEDIEKDNMLDVLGEVEKYAGELENPKLAY
jgi:hypothetical protein